MSVFRRPADFRSILALPRIKSLAVSSLLARMPKGIMPLTLVLLVTQRTGSYALAGTVTALFALGDAATAPWQGREGLVGGAGHRGPTAGRLRDGIPAAAELLPLRPTAGDRTDRTRRARRGRTHSRHGGCRRTLVDRGGPALAFAVPPVAVGVAATLAATLRRRMPSVFG
jgi:hypothetical protein